ncbi:Ig-like domain-containing protein [Delftia sp. ASV31]|uniref:Ig-like domain-containing protein n=3 Tax=Bacteria TaxID=2 RepID=UPI0018EC4CA2|nr:Ig-like domain-containing protein [Delftia sp. ASV31]
MQISHFTACLKLWRRLWTRLHGYGVVAAATALAMTAAIAADTAQLSIADGVVVKFGQGAGIRVHDRLQSGVDTLLTSRHDHSALGEVEPQQAPRQAKAGDWLGVLAAPEVAAGDLALDGLAIRYAGGADGLPRHMEGGAALVLGGASHALQGLKLTFNTVGIRVVGTGSPGITRSRIIGNAVGLLAEQGATPAIGGSDISGNTELGIRNTSPASIVQARGNWWGHVSGPRDPVANPFGRGNGVSPGVDYGDYLVAEPGLDCSIAPTQGYATRLRNVELRLDCPQAAQFRLQESTLFDSAQWSDMDSHPMLTSHLLSSGAGDKMVHAQFRMAQGGISQFSLPRPIAYAPEGPQLQFVQPVAGAVLEQDAPVVLQASDAEGVQTVEILIDGQRLALLTQPPFQATWALATVPDGRYNLQAIATNLLGLSSTISIPVQVQKRAVQPPTLSASFAGVLLLPDATITQAGQLDVAAQSPRGIANVKATINGLQIFERSGGNTSPFNHSQFIDFAQLPNGAHRFSITATDSDGIAAVLDIPFTLSLSAPPAPVIAQPVNNAQVSTPQLTVSGTAMAGSQVQLYLGGQAVGSPMAVPANGSFSGSLTLPAEGAHRIEATASNARGTSPRSAAVAVTYAIAAPTVNFTVPGQDATVVGSTAVGVAASAPDGIAKVDFFANGSLIGSATQAPFSVQWDTSGVANGALTLRAVATSKAGKTGEATRAVTVNNKPPEPEQPKTPYTGTVSSVSPAVSYGAQRVVIAGAAVSRASGQPMPNAALRMVLDISGFKRRIGIATDDSGQYRYEFVPTANDNGTYIVSVIHPEETLTTEQGRFTINRLSFDLASYQLTAPRGFAASITVNARASAGTGATGVRWAVVPAQQPSGSLPPGISVEPGAPVNVAAGASVPMVIRFTGSASAGETGTVVLTAYASETGDTPRGSFTIHYRLVQALPELFANPTYIETGVQQEKTVTESITIGNRGLVAAQDVKVQLVDKDGRAAPSWIFLSSASHIGAVDVGAQVPIQVTASPGKDVADGIYNYRLQITASNQGTGTIPVSVAVTQSGQGGLSFHATDLFTETLDAGGKPIPGVANVRIRLQNDAVLTYMRTLTTDAQGKAVLTDLPPGTYTYRASGPRHADRSGRIFVRPGVTTSERVHLQYQTISIDFSVTETTIKDEYQITLEATFQTQVPAPVVLLEPLSISLPELQVGEEFTGELTLTNYGLIQADKVVFTPPQSDEYYRYEFLADIPKTLAAKQRVVIPYRITAVKLHPRSMGFRQARSAEMGAVQSIVVNARNAGSCSSYAQWATAECGWVCANGEEEMRTVSSTFGRLVGGACGGSGGSSAPSLPRPEAKCEVINGKRYCSTGYPAGWGGPDGGYPATPLPLAPECTPTCRGQCCAGGGAGPGGGGSGGGGSGGGGAGAGGDFR